MVLLSDPLPRLFLHVLQAAQKNQNKKKQTNKKNTVICIVRTANGTVYNSAVRLDFEGCFRPIELGPNWLSIGIKS